ncbi:hypothetical protein BC835DRAFT_1341380 [Cytidiella melzeri]|nr:hypothetical protein BC835DRAFT_1341380 [Cytidiella melzeri]
MIPQAMIIIKDKHIYQSPNGNTVGEFEEFCRRYSAGQLAVEASCLSAFYPETPSLDWDGEDSNPLDAGVPGQNSHHQSQQLCMGGDAGLCVTFEEYIAQLALAEDDESTSRRLPHKTGADLPPELFAPILSYIQQDCMLVQIGTQGPRRLQPLETCALVCSHWANICRPSILRQRLECITSPNLLRSVKCMLEWKGGEHLTGLSRFVASNAFYVSVRAGGHERGGPWMHNVALLGIQAAVSYLTLTGHHVSQDTRSWFSKSPHWALPRSLPSCFTPFTEVELINMHAPSFNALIKLLRSFRNTRRFQINNVTWALGQGIAPAQSLVSGPTSVTPKSVSVETFECTDNGLLCLQTCLLYPEFPLRDVPEVERNIAARSLGLPNPRLWTGLDMEWDGTDDTVRFMLRGAVPACILSMTCPRHIATANAPNSRHILAFSIHFPSSLRASYTPIVNHAAILAAALEIPSLCYILISFNGLQTMYRNIGQYSQLRRDLQHVTCRFACRLPRGDGLRSPLVDEGILSLRNFDDTVPVEYRERAVSDVHESNFDSNWYVKTYCKAERKEKYTKHAWELIDPLTLKVTGEVFEEHDNIIPELLARNHGIFTVTAPYTPSEDDIRMQNFACNPAPPIPDSSRRAYSTKLERDQARHAARYLPPPDFRVEN